MGESDLSFGSASVSKHAKDTDGSLTEGEGMEERRYESRDHEGAINTALAAAFGILGAGVGYVAGKGINQNQVATPVVAAPAACGVPAAVSYVAPVAASSCGCGGMSESDYRLNEKMNNISRVNLETQFYNMEKNQGYFGALSQEILNTRNMVVISAYENQIRDLNMQNQNLRDCNNNLAATIRENKVLCALADIKESLPPTRRYMEGPLISPLFNTCPAATTSTTVSTTPAA